MPHFMALRPFTSTQTPAKPLDRTRPGFYYKAGPARKAA